MVAQLDRNLPANSGDKGLGSLVWEDPTCRSNQAHAPQLLSPAPRARGAATKEPAVWSPSLQEEPLLREALDAATREKPCAAN